VDVAHRYDKFRDHVKDLPNLAKHYSVDLKRKPLGLHEKPRHKDPHPPGQDPHKPAHNGSVTKVQHKPASPQQQLHHALAGHQHHVQHHPAPKKPAQKK
jgi:hypothetical protein